MAKKPSKIKRRKKGKKTPKKPTPSQSPLTTELLSPKSRKQYKGGYLEATPWRHIQMQPLCSVAAMTSIRTEITNLKATFKETDIFKVFQVRRDLCDMTGLEDKLPNLLALRDALYTTEFREFVSEVTACGPLTEKVDMSANVYSHGCHLLCHDDTIGTRRVSYIIYFSDGDWTPEDGGGLQLFPHKDGCQTEPGRVLVPTFNSMCLFEVVPGRSYHAVQEVFSKTKTRVSIQGWFHAACEPERKEDASRMLLQSHDPEVIQRQDNLRSPWCSISPNNDGAALSKADKTYLSDWLNPAYLQDEHIHSIRRHFQAEASIQLRDFLRPELEQEIQHITQRADRQDRHGDTGPLPYRAGTRAGWDTVGPPPQRLFLRWTPQHDESQADKICASWKSALKDEVSGVGTRAEARGQGSAEGREFDGRPGPLLGSVAYGLMRSGPFRRLLHCFTAQRFTRVRADVRRFRPGLDYTVASAASLTLEPRLDATLCFVKTKQGASSLTASAGECGEQQAIATDAATVAGIAGSTKAGSLGHQSGAEGSVDPDKAWRSGDVGGFQAYLPSSKTDNADEAATYDADADGDAGLLSFPASNNTLNLVLHVPNTHKFVKYVNSVAPGSRWDVALEYQLDKHSTLPESESDDDELIDL